MDESVEVIMLEGFDSEGEPEIRLELAIKERLAHKKVPL
jgi:hypothetical protein